VAVIRAGPELVSGQGQRLLRIGVALFLITSFWGFLIPALPSSQLNRSVHTLAALEGVMLIAFGLLWAKLRLSAIGTRFAFW
jgi:hydroxylaminobenzene mutase